MHFASLCAGEPHARQLSPRVLAGPPRSHDPLGGSVRSEEQFFRLLDLLSYFHARRGLVEREEIALALPGWLDRSDALERQHHRSMTALQVTFGLDIQTVSESGCPAMYRLNRQHVSPMLAYALGRSDALHTIDGVSQGNWSTLHCLSVIAGVLRTFALTRRDAWLQPSDVQAQWPLTPELLRQFVRRWHRQLPPEVDTLS